MEQGFRQQLLAEISAQEQSWFWTRFAAFSAIHAALLVLLATQEGPEVMQARAWLVLGVGLVLAAAWAYIQAVSLWYVNRYKADFGDLLELANLRKKRPAYFPISSTQCGL